MRGSAHTPRVAPMGCRFRIRAGIARGPSFHPQPLVAERLIRAERLIQISRQGGAAPDADTYLPGRGYPPEIDPQDAS